MTRVSTMGNYQSALLDLMKAQGRQQLAQERLDSEKIATDSKGYGRSSQNITALKATQSRLAGFVASGEAVEARLASQDIALSRVGEGGAPLGRRQPRPGHGIGAQVAVVEQDPGGGFGHGCERVGCRAARPVRRLIPPPLVPVGWMQRKVEGEPGGPPSRLPVPRYPEWPWAGAAVPYSVAGSSRGSAMAASASPRSAQEKQERRPVWQATPTWSTSASTASPSQSRRSSRRCCTWPEVSPLRQRPWRERL